MTQEKELAQQANDLLVALTEDILAHFDTDDDDPNLWAWGVVAEPKILAALEQASTRLRDMEERLVETQMLAHKWMEAHDKLHSGKPYDFPKPADLPEALARLRDMERALAKLSPIKVHDGPDYAEVYFGDGKGHSTQAMTMNPQDWRDLAALTGNRGKGDA